MLFNISYIIDTRFVLDLLLYIDLPPFKEQINLFVFILSIKQ